MEKTSPGPVTNLLVDYAQGDEAALEALIRQVYPVLRRMARRIIAGERVDHTLSATGLVHEGFLRMFGQRHPSLTDSRHFFLTASTVMQHVLTDHARKKLAAKRRDDGSLRLPTSYSPNELLVMGELMERLEVADHRAAEVVRLRFYMGMTDQEAAAALGITPSRVQQEWKWARAWLRAELNGAWGPRKAVPSDAGPARSR